MIIINNNILDETKKACIGCSVCYIECPRDAIKIKVNSEGFFQADIFNDKCIGCGKCKKVCYKFNNIEGGFKIENSIIYGSYSANEDIRMRSSSGGVGYELCSWGIENGYKVCGVKYNYEKNIAEHCIIENKEDLAIISGSKYIPSYTLDALKNLDFINNKYIIIGTPCQVFGLRQYLIENKVEDKVILVDFFCHGVPSYLAWNKYLDYIREKNEVESISHINFKNKNNGWHNSHMEILGENFIYYSSINEDLFLKVFLSNTCLNKECYECKFRFNKLYSDIRLGDFWGEKYKKDKLGVSIVLLNSSKGKNLFENLNKRLIFESATFEELSQSQNYNMKKPKTRNNIMKKLTQEIKLEDIYNNYFYKIAIKQNIKQRIKKIIRRGI